MSRGRSHSLAGRYGPLLAVAIGVLGYLGWRQLRTDPLDSLFESLPADHGLYAYLDVETIRSSLSFAGGDTLPDLLAEKGRLADHLSVLTKANVEGVALSVGVDEIHAAGWGAFHVDALRSYIEQQDMTCTGPDENLACSIESEDTTTEIHLRDGNRIEIIDRSIEAHRTPDSGDASFLTGPARTSLRNGAILWMALHPPQLEAAMKHPPRDMVNLTLFARALKGATIAYVVLEPNLASRLLDLKLIALAPSSDLAAKMHRVVEDTNNLAAAAIDASSREGESSAWAQLFRTGEFTQEGTTVQASWRLDPKKLQELFPNGSKAKQ